MAKSGPIYTNRSGQINQGTIEEGLVDRARFAKNGEIRSDLHKSAGGGLLESTDGPAIRSHPDHRIRMGTLCRVGGPRWVPSGSSY